MAAKKDVNSLVEEFQLQNQQLQAVLIQKQSLVLQSNEMDKALEELKFASSDVYRAVGQLLVKTTREDTESRLNEEKEELGFKLKAVENQESSLKSKLLKKQEELRSMTKGNAANGG